MRSPTFLPLLALLFHATSSGADPVPTHVHESARGLPIAREVDVVVVGGTTGAVAAAAEAARHGARVFLAAPYPYLGEDMTATLRLWLEEGESPRSPLAARIHSDPLAGGGAIDPRALVRFEYASSLPPSGVHRDTSPPSALSDGRFGTATAESVQYDGDVEIEVRLAEEEDVESVRVFPYHARDFQVDRVRVQASLDGKVWAEAGGLQVAAPAQGGVTEPALDLSVPVGTRARFVKVSVSRARESTRVLLGEIAVLRRRPQAPAEARPTPPPPRPLHVKKVLDEELLAAGVPYLYSSYATDLLVDRDGMPAGIVMANRAGRQAVIARVVVDATETALLARLGGARFRVEAMGGREVRRVVIGGTPRAGHGLRSRSIGPPWRAAGRDHPMIEYAIDVVPTGEGPAERARIDRLAMDATFHPDQQFASDALFRIPADRIEAEVEAAGEWRGDESLPLGAFRPAGVPRLFVLGGRAGIPRPWVERALRPVALVELGARVGRAAARTALSAPEPSGVRVRGSRVDGALAGDVRETLTGVRPVDEPPGVPQEERGVPVLGRYDVVVVGGGTGGAPAGIAAARGGARTLVIEYLHGLGGVGTLGAISKYYWGNRVGFSATVEGGSASWRIEERAEWWRRALNDAGGDAWFGSLGCGAFVVGNRVAGVVVATPEGRGVVLADVVIDATGNSDIAAAAGAATLYTDATDVAMQGTGLPPRNLGESYTNTDFTIADETDMLDVWSVFVTAKERASGAFDLGKLIDTRERRRILGDFTVTILDQLNDRTYPDTIVECWSDFDSHGYTTDPYFTLDHPPHGKGVRARVPYRALLPRRLDGILVTGLGISVHRDAVPLVRMQPDVQNLGYAAGLAAAAAARQGKGTRGIDVRAVQRALVDVGNLSPDVLAQEDSYPIPEERVAAAVEAAGDGYARIPEILARPEAALPLLRKAHAAAETHGRRLVYAHILAVLGDPAGVPDLIEAVESAQDLDRGWRYTGMGQYGPNMSPLDRLIYALGRAGDRRATPAIVAKLRLLEPDDEFSHFRAMALALESLGDPAAVGPLADLLSRPGMRGHAETDIQAAVESARRHPSWTATEPRSLAIRELILGRALFLCGDRDGLGRRILQEFTRDLRGHLSRHASAVLKGRRELD